MSPGSTPQLHPSDARTINAYIAEQPGAVAAFLEFRATRDPDYEPTPAQSRLALRDTRYLLKLSTIDIMLYGWELFNTIALAQLTSNDLALTPDAVPTRATAFAEASADWWRNLTFEQRATAFLSLCKIVHTLNFRLPNEILAPDTPEVKTLNVFASEHLYELASRTKTAREDDSFGMWGKLLLHSHWIADRMIPEAYLPVFGDLDPDELAHATDSYTGPQFAQGIEYFDPCRQRLSFDPHSPVDVEAPATLCVDDLAISGPELEFSGNPPSASLQRNYALSQRNLALVVADDLRRAETPHLLMEAATFAVQIAGTDGLQADQYTDAKYFPEAYERIKKQYPNLPERFDPKPEAPPLTITVTTELTAKHLALLYPYFDDAYGLGEFATRSMVEAFIARSLHKHGEPSPTSLDAASSSLPDEQRAQLRRLFPDAYGT